MSLPGARPDRSMISRLTPMRGGDPMLDPYNPTMFETSRWASSFKPRSAWISEEYQRAFKTVEPWNMEDSMKSRRQWLSDDLLNTYKTREPWNVKGLQDWPGQTKKQWMKVTPKDRYGGDSRSVFKEIDAPFTRPAASDLIDYGGEYDSFKGGPTQGTNIEQLDTDALSGWDAEGGVHVQPDHVSVEMQTLSKMDPDLAAQFAGAGVPIKNENDSFLDSNGDFGTGANQDSIGGSLVDADRIARLNDPDYARVEQRLLPDPGGTAEVHTAQKATLVMEDDSDDEYNELLTDTEEVLPEVDEEEELSASELTETGEDSVTLLGDPDEGGVITPFGTDPGEEPSFEDTVVEPDEPSFSDTRVEGEPAVGGGRGPVIEPAKPVVDPHAVEPNFTAPRATPSELSYRTQDSAGWGSQLTRPRQSRWSNFMGRRQDNMLTDPLLGDTEMMSLNQRPRSSELVPELGDAEVNALNTLISGEASRQHVYTDIDTGGLKGAALAEDMGIGLGRGKGGVAGAVGKGLGKLGEAALRGPGGSAYTGLFISKTTFGGWLAKQGKGLVAAPAVYLLTTWLNSIAPGAGDYISMGLLVGDLVTSGDPLGAIAYGLGQLYAASAKARQKVIDNDIPDKGYGTRMGYVREGDTWYPAFYNKKFESTGMFASDNNFTMSYGTDLIWMQDGQGGWEPYFTDGRTMDFVAQDNELNKKQSSEGYRFDSKEAIDDRLSTRDWYFLSDEDAKAVISGHYPGSPEVGDAVKQVSFDSYTEDATEIVDGHRREVNDWRKALEMSQDWKWSTAVHTLGANAHVNEYEGSRELHRILRESNDGMQDYTKFNADGTPESYEDYKRRFQQGKSSEVGAAYDAWDETQRPLTGYIFKEVLPDHLKALYKAQRIAAKESGFEKMYTNEWYDANYNSFDKDRNYQEGQTVWSSMYLDTENDFALARSSEELAKQLDQIELMDNRTAAQRNYLAQKVQTRYWMQQVSDMGQTSEMMHMLYGRDSGGAAFADPYNMRTTMLTAMRSYKDATYQEDGDLHSKDWTFNDGPGTRLAAAHLADLPGWIAPWQNAGENILPDFSRGDDYGMQDLMTSYRWAAFERMSTEAQQNAADWIKRTSGYDPNLVISQGKKVDMGANNRSILDSTGSYVDTTVQKEEVEEVEEEVDPVEEVEEEVDKPPVVPVEAETFEDMMQEGHEEEEEQYVEEEPVFDPNLDYTQMGTGPYFEGDERALHAAWRERHNIDAQERDVDEKRGKAEIEQQKARWDLELEKGLWAWDDDVPDPYANSHVPDAVPDNMHGVSVLMPESILHEEQTFVHMTPAFESAIAALEAGPAIGTGEPYTGELPARPSSDPTLQHAEQVTGSILNWMEAAPWVKTI